MKQINKLYVKKKEKNILYLKLDRTLFFRNIKCKGGCGPVSFVCTKCKKDGMVNVKKPTHYAKKIKRGQSEEQAEKRKTKYVKITN
eukprot:Pgem_evm1s17268